jgi:hypothetical protein
VPSSQPPDTIIAQLLWLVLAAFGGIARYADESMRHESAITLIHLLGHGLVSAFSGYMFAIVALLIYPDWASVMAGIGGYLGTQGLSWVTKLVQNKLGVPQTEDTGSLK